jgi:hypothetical protein
MTVNRREIQFVENKGERERQLGGTGHRQQNSGVVDLKGILYEGVS